MKEILCVCIFIAVNAEQKWCLCEKCLQSIENNNIKTYTHFAVLHKFACSFWCWVCVWYVCMDWEKRAAWMGVGEPSWICYCFPIVKCDCVFLFLHHTIRTAISSKVVGHMWIIAHIWSNRTQYKQNNAPQKKCSFK